ncbi:MAG: hypothetical protein COS99_06295 [Candidatus Omnitrophica bacterium CG07_land_8_20_14_0_80_42_15]|uniref:tRNA-binding domain-containing protein n=1 Tax=Candidatus Aquitaenariimonas noxiae TaxID=1974741 RepID=A0A2J0KRT7_9BACT|nr:MAG: hypothetical protein COS99_06295 [Candidatus Omnitrophica bacterium CG07_land_8_20_14_0_80_42_15]
MISFEDFKKLEIKIAEIKDVKLHPNADKLYVITIDVGGLQKEIIAGIKEFYSQSELIGKKVVVLNNLEPVKIRGVESSAMLLVAKDAKTLGILIPDRSVDVGSPVS